MRIQTPCVVKVNSSQYAHAQFPENLYIHVCVYAYEMNISMFSIVFIVVSYTRAQYYERAMRAGKSRCEIKLNLFNYAASGILLWQYNMLSLAQFN